MKKLKLFVWENVLSNYTDGIVFAIAEDEIKARKMLIEKKSGLNNKGEKMKSKMVENKHLNKLVSRLILNLRANAPNIIIQEILEKMKKHIPKDVRFDPMTNVLFTEIYGILGVGKIIGENKTHYFIDTENEGQIEFPKNHVEG